MDKYSDGGGHGCYPGTSTLINLLDIRSETELAAAERDITECCAAEIEFSPPPYNLSYLCDIHRALFKDIYPWAGTLRSVDLSKGDTHFCHAQYLQAEADKLFAHLAALGFLEGLERHHLVAAVAEFYGDINMLHPFREGNGRTQRIMFEHLVVNAGFEIYWDDVSAGEWVAANIAAVVCDYGPLSRIFQRCIGAPLA